MSDNVVIFEQESQTRAVILGYLSECNNIIVDKIFDNYNEGFRYVKENRPKIVLFSMTEDISLCNKIISRLSSIGINIAVISENYTTSAIIEALRLGAKDFVSKPVLKSDLFEALNKCSQNETKSLKKSQIISVYSTKGGVGKTVIATNLAVELARLTRDKVALVDLDLPMGDITTFLDISPTPNILNMALESENIKDACKQYKDSSLYVLAEPPKMEQIKGLNTNHIVKLFNNLRNEFPFIIVDMGTSIDKFNMTILENSDFILLTTIVNLPLIRNCQHCIDLLDNNKIDSDKVKIVINRYLENDEITVVDVEKALDKPVYWKIPNNYYTVMSSINKGIPVAEINENSNITENFSQLASHLLEDMFEKDLSLITN